MTSDLEMERPVTAPQDPRTMDPGQLAAYLADRRAAAQKASAAWRQANAGFIDFVTAVNAHRTDPGGTFPMRDC
jgi:hypothetical protein